MTNIYIATPQGVLVVRRQKDGWQTELQLSGRPAQCLAADPLHPEWLYCGTFGQGLWRSADAGAIWEPVGAGITQPQMMAVAVSANERAGDHGVVYAGSEPTALFRSDDGGATWRECTGLTQLPSAPTWSFPPRPYTSHVRAIALDPQVPGRLYVAVEAGALVRSADGGQTWTDRVPSGPFDSHTLAMHPQVPGWIGSAAGDGFMAPGQGYCETYDSGATWTRPGAGLGFHYLWGLAVDPGDPQTLIVSCAPSPMAAHNPAAPVSAIYRRHGDGPWQQVHAGLPESQGMLASTLAANPAEPGVFYAVNNRGLFRSPDAGQSWERLPVPDAQVFRGESLLVTPAA